MSINMIVCGRHTTEYITAIRKYAERLEATEVLVHANGTVDLICPDGYICENYYPTAKELYYYNTELSESEMCFYARSLATVTEGVSV